MQSRQLGSVHVCALGLGRASMIEFDGECDEQDSRLPR